MISMGTISPPYSVSQVIDLYVGSKGHGQLVSTEKAIAAVRYMFPLCDLSREELVAMITRSAVDAGSNIVFDAEERRPPS